MNTTFHPLIDYLRMFENNHLVSKYELSSQNKRDIIKYISSNSKDVRPGTLFVCKGAHFSINYLKEALNDGAICYISEKKYDVQLPDGSDVPYILVTDIRKAMPLLADYYYNRIWEKLKIIGITGTKGKSTTTYYMKFILDEYLKAQKKSASAVISGIDNYDGIISGESHLTTPEAMDLHRHFYNAVNSGIEYLSMEVSSQGLKYHRTLGVTFEVGCFLNIGIDHISDIEHNSFDDYLESKLLLFAQCKKACVNIDTDYVDRVLEASKACPEVITFGLDEKADVYGYDIIKSGNSIQFKVRTQNFTEEFKLNMAGLFNVQNALAAIAMSCCLDIPLEYIHAGLEKARVSGRMEIYTNPARNIDVIVDYAHNQLSFETLFESTKKEYPDKEISIVFGCPGKKALGRRRELGEIAGKYSDKVYITEEDAGEEAVIKICEEIAEHVRTRNPNYAIIPDREEAIRTAITHAKDNSVILVTGKGRETRQK